MAEVLGVQARSLSRWWTNQQAAPPDKRPLGRPKVIAPEVASRLREQYLTSYGQWGPRVLAHWAQREGLGSYSPTTIAEVIADLRPEPPPKKEPLRYDVVSVDVMWSEDGAGFRDRGRKRELLLVQDECSRYKVAHDLCAGPATGQDVRKLLQAAFEEHGAPLVLKRDGGSIFDEHNVRELLDEWGVVTLTSPPATPWYNGRMEHAVRDVRSFERAQREHGVRGSLDDRIDQSIGDLNENRPRPMLRGCTAREVQDGPRARLPDRGRFRQEVERETRELEAAATSRHERDAASRRATERVLSRYGLLKWKGNVSTDLSRETVTN